MSDGSDSSSDEEEEKEANAAMAGYSMMMPQLSAEWALGGLVPWFRMLPAPLMWDNFSLHSNLDGRG